MNAAFEVHMLTAAGKEKAALIAKCFDTLTEALLVSPDPHTPAVVPQGREASLVLTKLEEACFFAKKGMAKSQGNHE